MAAKTQKTETPNETQTDVRTQLETIETLQQQARQIAAQLKEAQASLSPLDKVIAKQVASPANIILLQRVKARIGAGQSRHEAIAAVIVTSTEWLEAELDRAAEAE
jgi:hypothetical protein